MVAGRRFSRLPSHLSSILRIFAGQCPLHREVAHNDTLISRYGDVQHRIMEVTSSYRFVQTYNLSNLELENPTKLPADFESKRNELENTLILWKDGFKKNEPGCPSSLAYILEHLYTSKTLSYAGLKAGDAVRAEYLHELCGKHGFLFFLAKLEHGEAENVMATVMKTRGKICIGVPIETKNHRYTT